MLKVYTLSLFILGIHSKGNAGHNVTFFIFILLFVSHSVVVVSGSCHSKNSHR
jgi:hypothetical protein